MRYMYDGFGYGGMMGGNYVLCWLIGVVVLVDLVLVGVWLWKQINKK